MGLKLHTEMVKDAAAHNQCKFGQADDRLLKRHITRQMKELVTNVIEREIDAGAITGLTTEELQLLSSRLPDLGPDDFKLTEAIVEALVPQSTGQKINLDNEGINIPDDDAK